MHDIFIDADPLAYASRTLPVRLNGVTSYIRLENLFWSVLEEIGRRDGIGIVSLVEKLYDDQITAHGKVGDFTSFLRVTALRYQALMALGRIPRDQRVPIRTLDPRRVMHALPDGFGRAPVGLQADRPEAAVVPPFQRLRFPG